MAKHKEFENELNVQVTTMITEKHIKHNLMGLDWKSLQENDPIIQHVLKWKCCNSNKNAKKDKNAHRHTLEEYLLTVVNSHDAKVYGNRQKDFTLLNDMLFINDTPKGSTDTALLFVVPASKHQAALDLCHRDVGHQGRDRMYSLLQERFWWPKIDADDDDPTELREMQGVQEERPQGTLVHNCRYGTNGPHTCRFDRNGSHC